MNTEIKLNIMTNKLTAQVLNEALVTLSKHSNQLSKTAIFKHLTLKGYHLTYSNLNRIVNKLIDRGYIKNVAYATYEVIKPIDNDALSLGKRPCKDDAIAKHVHVKKSELQKAVDSIIAIICNEDLDDVSKIEMIHNIVKQFKPANS